MRSKKLFALLLALMVALSACGSAQEGAFGGQSPSPSSQSDAPSAAAPEQPSEAAPAKPEGEEPSDSPAREKLPEYGGWYYDVENVVLYLDAYGELPPNYITKEEARDLGWTGGSVEDYLEGAAIGGDRFGNYEELLPAEVGRTYTECDIDTDGYPSRGSRRLVFSNDGLYFYTSDHYESFREVVITDDYEVRW